jgi:hypothetical protein
VIQPRGEETRACKEKSLMGRGRRVARKECRISATVRRAPFGFQAKWTASAYPHRHITDDERLCACNLRGICKPDFSIHDDDDVREGCSYLSRRSPLRVP